MLSRLVMRKFHPKIFAETLSGYSARGRSSTGIPKRAINRAAENEIFFRVKKSRKKNRKNKFTKLSTLLRKREKEKKD